MKIEASAGDFVATTYTDGHPYMIELEHKGFRDGKMSFDYRSLPDLEFVVKRMIGKIGADNV